MLDKSHETVPYVKDEVQPQREFHLSHPDASNAEQIRALNDAVHELLKWRQRIESGISAFQTAASAHLQALSANNVALANTRIREQESIGAFQEAASRHLERLSQQMQTLQAQVRSLDDELHATGDELHATPYMADPALLKVADAQGRITIGFSSPMSAPDDGYRGFEDIFRGPEAFIRERQRIYLPFLAGHDSVLDVGCGRGEFLDLLAEAQISALGLDMDEGMVARSRAKGHEVLHIDALRYLRDAEPRSFGVIFAAQVIEHFAYDDFLDFLGLAQRALQPGGLLIMETVNPHALPAFKTFSTDLTHHHPIFPEVAVAFCRLQGYDTAAVLFPNGIGDFERDRRTQGEYAVFATISGPHGEQTNPLLAPTLL